MFNIKIFIIIILTIMAKAIFAAASVPTTQAADSSAQTSGSQQQAAASDVAQSEPTAPQSTTTNTSQAGVVSEPQQSTSNAPQTTNASATTSQQPAVTANSSPPAKTSAPEYLYCPDPSRLMKEGNWWKIGNIWISDSQSSGKKIKEFIGAQWVGVKFGKIICLYSEDEKYAFPVALVTVNPVLILDPTTSSWMSTKQGYKDCVSHSVFDCPFLQQKPNDVFDVYEQIKYKDENKE